MWRRIPRQKSTCTGFASAGADDKVTGIDRGVARPIQTQDTTSRPRQTVTAKQQGREKYLKRCQRKLARQQKGSRRRDKTKRRIATLHCQTRNARNDFLHWASRPVVDASQVIVMEDLKLRNMTRRPKPRQCPRTGQWLRNHANAKTGLNRALLGVGLYQFEAFVTYKAERKGKAVFKVNPQNTSRECAACGYTHPGNRRRQSVFRCKSCGHTDNGDRNAARVSAKRATKLILHPGTGLSGRRGNVLLPAGTHVKPRKTREAQATRAAACPSKKKRSAMIAETRAL